MYLYFLDAQFWQILTAIFGHVISRFKNQCTFCYQCNLDLNLKCYYQVQLTRKNIYKGYINLWNSVVRRGGWDEAYLLLRHTQPFYGALKKGKHFFWLTVPWPFLATDCRLSRLNSVEGKKKDWNSTPNCISQMT